MTRDILDALLIVQKKTGLHEALYYISNPEQIVWSCDTR